MFTIGEFSRFAQVTPNLLRHYDQIGLFKPAHTDKRTGYRYYDVSQLPDLNMILSLKDLGLSLDQIRQMVSDNVTLPEIQGMLKHQRLLARDTIRQELQRLQRIEARLQHLEQDNPVTSFAVTEKPRSAQPWLRVEKTAYPHLDNGAFFGEVYQACSDVLSQSDVYCVCAMNGMAITDDNWSMGITLPKGSDTNRALVPSLSLESDTLPAYEAVASVVYNGPLADYYRAYNALAFWIDQNGYQSQGGVYEWVYRIEITPTGDDSTVEIQVPLATNVN